MDDMDPEFESYEADERDDWTQYCYEMFGVNVGTLPTFSNGQTITHKEKELLDALKYGMQYAYDKGLHEMGYDPVKDAEIMMRQSIPLLFVATNLNRLKNGTLSQESFMENIRNIVLENGWSDKDGTLVMRDLYHGG
jgi:hypothetical protein